MMNLRPFTTADFRRPYDRPVAWGPGQPALYGYDPERELEVIAGKDGTWFLFNSAIFGKEGTYAEAQALAEGLPEGNPTAYLLKAGCLLFLS